MNVIKNRESVPVIFDMSADTALKERVRLREKALHDEASALQGAKEEGLKEGIAKTKQIFKLSMQGHDIKKIAEILSISEDEVMNILK